jgi:hypothetical protein
MGSLTVVGLPLLFRRRCRSGEEELDNARISAFFSRSLDDMAEPAAGNLFHAQAVIPTAGIAFKINNSTVQADLWTFEGLR